MKSLLVSIGMVLMIGWSWGLSMDAAETEEVSGNKHNWEQMSTDFKVIPTDSHEFTYWKNFIRHTKTCDVSLKIKTTVFYCDVHKHTKSSTELVETIHSYDHK